MKRFHVHVRVKSIEESTAFYTALFNTAPSTEKIDYVKWMLEDPKVNFAISSGHAESGIEHLGIQSESPEELEEVYANMQVAKGKVLEEGACTCCYSKSKKSWITDPQGVDWEAFYTHGTATVYGEGINARPAPDAMEQWTGNDEIDQKTAPKKPIVSSIVKSSLMLLLGLVFIFFSSCSECCASVSQLIPSLQPLQEIQGHYASLAAFDASQIVERKELDAIKFPNKSNVLITRALQPAYLSRAELTELRKTLHPPANSSQQTRKELDFLLNLQETRTPQQVEEALRMNEVFYFPVVTMNDEKDLFFEALEIFGSDFPIEKYPKTQHLLNNLMKEMRIMEFDAKNHILRARPRQLEANLQPLKKMSSSSFASGHTLWAYIQAYTFAELVPNKRTDFLELAYQIGFTREILGVHYPSDEEASRKLSHQMLTRIWEKEEFKKDFHAAKLEWK